MKRQGFTLIELLVIIAILGLLAAVLFPVFIRVREKGRQTVCASNLHQLDLAIEAYTQDYDGHHPASTGVSPFTGLPAVNSTAWAGRIYPYVKNTPVFHCPTDATPGVTTALPRVPVSYSLNANLAAAPSESSLTSPSHTILLFEVSDDQAAVTLPSERVGDAAPQVSATGDGVNGALLNLTGLGADRMDGAVYATGLMDNKGDGSLLPFDQYLDKDGQHSGGSNFLVADGHVAWRKGSEVSAGGNALASPDVQAAAGCQIHSLGVRGDYPCAEGASNGKYALTFSVR